MRLPKEIINVLGIVVTVAIVVVGVVLIALPLFSAALSQASAVAQAATGNATSQSQIDRLKAATQDLPATTSHVAQLRTQVPVANDFDDVFQVVNAAAGAAHATLTSVQPLASVTYTTRTATVAAAAATATNGSSAPAPAPSPSPSAPSSSASTGTGPSAGASTTHAGGARQQVPVTVTVTVPDAKSAAVFLDALSHGPRIVTVSHTTLTSSGSTSGAGSKTTFTLTVNALTYTSSEG